ncbi:MAG: sarcosine oxidase subunit delta [Candidatus Binatia bacterium]
MLLIPCPYCGPREQAEFHYGGAAHIEMPPDGVDDETWGRYLFYRPNPQGLFAERWVHQHGCRRWFNAVRDTATHEIVSVYRMGAPRP